MTSTRSNRACAALLSCALAPLAWAQRTSPRQNEALDALSGSFEQIAERVAPSVVQIFTSGYSVGSGQGNLLTRQFGTASGIVIDADGYVVTNAHVVAGAGHIEVLLATRAENPKATRAVLRPEGGKLHAQVVGIDTDTDLALLKVPRSGLPALALADSDKLKPGQLVLAFGSPLGLGNTVTMGIVSAVARQLSADDSASYVQTDAPVNPGNSGGPLVDTKGQVVGINTMILSQSGGSEGVGLAIPSNVVRYITDQLRGSGRVRRGVIGVQVQTVNSTMAAALGLPQVSGVIVADVDGQGPAGKAGLQIGDVILSTDGKTVENVRQFGANLYRHAIDATVVLEIQRGTQRMSLTIPVIERADDPTRFVGLADPKKNLIPALGILGLDVDAALASVLAPLRMSSGVLVAAVRPDAVNTGDGFAPGDVIHGLNFTPITTLDELRAALLPLKERDPVVVLIERRGGLQFVAMELD